MTLGPLEPILLTAHGLSRSLYMGIVTVSTPYHLPGVFLPYHFSPTALAWAFLTTIVSSVFTTSPRLAISGRPVTLQIL